MSINVIYSSQKNTISTRSTRLVFRLNFIGYSYDWAKRSISRGSLSREYGTVVRFESVYLGNGGNLSRPSVGGAVALTPVFVGGGGA